MNKVRMVVRPSPNAAHALRQAMQRRRRRWTTRAPNNGITTRGVARASSFRPPIGFPELDFEFVEESAQVLALPAGHRLASKRQLKWSDFDGEAMVMVQPNMQHGYYDPFLAACAKAGSKLRVVQYVNDIHIKMWLVSAGIGIAPTTATLAELRRPGLIFRPLPPGLKCTKARMWTG